MDKLRMMLDQNNLIGALVLAAMFMAFAGIGHAFAKEPRRVPQIGIASWYGPESGRITANGERFKWGSECRTAAHRYLPFNTRVRVTVLKTGRSIVVRISDRGPFIRGRIIDLCRGAGKALGMDGVARVRVEIIK